MKNFKFIHAAFLTPLMMFAACSTNDGPSFSENYETVTFTFATEDQVAGTRAESNSGISKGDKIDVLVFAIFDQSDTTTPLGDGGVYPKGSSEINLSYKLPKGYYHMAFTGEETPVSITLNKNNNYTIVCWAQNSGCDAYDASNLKAVKIDYAPSNNKNNNDEYRDAFCVAQNFKGSENQVTVTLHRPLAQINVGTTGADYRANSMKINGAYYTHTKVTIKGQLANQLDIFTGNATTSDAAGTEYTFGYAALPAYYKNESIIPTTDDDLLELENEEFLKVNLDKETGYLPYKTNYPTIKKDEEGKIESYLTETFKYLSMTYVLPVGNIYKYTGTPVDFKVEFAKAETAGAATTATSLSLNQIPLNPTWRTNILGGLAWIVDPDPANKDENFGPDPDPDPEDPKPTPDPGPDDPSSLFGSVTLNIVICPDYFGEWNKTDGTGDNKPTENPNIGDHINDPKTDSGSSNSGSTGE